MGCVNTKNKIKINSNLNSENSSYINIKYYNSNKINLFKNINEKSLFKIFNFFEFKELQEIGKVDYNFMKNSRNPDLFIKFFENKNYIKSKETTNIKNENIIEKLATFQGKNIKN